MAEQKTSRGVKNSQVSEYLELLDDVQQTAEAPMATTIDINNEIAREQKIKNDNAEQDITLKRKTLNRLFWFLGLETAVIFAFALMQAIGRPDAFHLEDWSFRLLVSATIAQITGMLFVAVRYLFPKSK